MENISVSTFIENLTTGNFENIEDTLPFPKMNKNMSGYDLFGYPADQLALASIYYNSYLKNMEYDKAEIILNQLIISNNIQLYSFIYKKNMIKNIENIDFLQGKRNISDVFIELYSKFLNKSEDEIRNIIANSDEKYDKNWNQIVTDEDNITLDQLGKFYNSLEFPSGSLLSHIFNSELAMAYRALPILIINMNNCKKVFDFGGNTGETLITIANGCNVESCYLIEENETALSFAKWRDELFNVSNVHYLKESELDNNIQDYKDTFDFGICTEVLEHVYDVEETAEKLSELLKKDGILYFSASFGFYPMASHLKKNIKYAGKEDELMAKYGLKRVNFNFPIPMISNISLYIKE